MAKVWELPPRSVDRIYEHIPQKTKLFVGPEK